MKLNEIVNDLSNKFKLKLEIKERPYYFDDIIIKVDRKNRSEVVLYIKANYYTYMKLRVSLDDALIYSYIGASKEKIDKVRKQYELQKIRFKWLHEQIKDEQVFLKNVIKEK